MEDWKQALLLFAVSEGYADELELQYMSAFESELFPFMETNYAALVEVLKTGAKADVNTLAEIRTALDAYMERD